MKELEDEISRLKQKLYEQQTRRSTSPRQWSAPRNSTARPRDLASNTASNHSSEFSSASLPRVSLSAVDMTAHEFHESKFDSGNRSPDAQSSNEDPLSDLLYSGWNPDLPDPATLDHYIDIFFRCDPCGSRILHKPSFVASVKMHPKDPLFPHSAILHAICASASRWSPQHIVEMPDGTRHDRFAEFHAGKTRQYIDKTMASGEDILFVMQACIILSWYFYQEGRWVEVWIFAGFQTRVAIPLRLNYPGTFSALGNNSPAAYLAPPKDLRDLECRRRTWWMTILFDRIASVGGWIHAVDERDIGTEFPLRTEDFEAERPVVNNPQNLAYRDVFIHHPPQYTDSFLLYIKAIMLFGKVTDFNVRGNLRATTPPSKNQNPFYLEGFEPLDKLVSHDFLESLPHLYKNSAGLSDSSGNCVFDTDLYMVHVIPHAATITLHNSYVDFTDPQCVSTARCVHAARSILGAYYTLSASSMDITRLHPFVTICWYLAAVALIQLCKYFIEINDAERESTVWGEINVLRFAMLTYGRRSPIGTRQERLLQGLMGEIIRMTAQKQPLEVGVPLYRFSHRTTFRKGEVSIMAPEDNATASLSRNTRYRERLNMSSGQPSAGGPSRHTGWAGRSEVHSTVATFLA
ncbi:hypothetical protein AX14_005539 [Amanita brunnescens Koide BX004]|nr:hypothetical protein AX14_005539 [Amanita brunnescens Koide BX004]